MIKIDIRPLEETELHRFQLFPFGSMDTHRKRFEMQQMGNLVFLVAWWDDLPVGQVLLNWVGGDASGVPPQVRPLPEVSSLFVTRSYRRKGFATRLLDVAEHMTFAHGHDQMGLCVAETNRGAQKLYFERGYYDSGWPPYLAQGIYTDSSGSRRKWEEKRLYFVKDLGGVDSADACADKKKQAAD